MEHERSNFFLNLKEYIWQFWWYFRQWWRREPHLIVGSLGTVYLHRWWLIPRNPIFNAYAHLFISPDEDRALHDHSWVSLSIVLRGSYMELTETTKQHVMQRRAFGPGSIIFRWPTCAHRIDLYPEEASGKFKPVWTLFLTGPKWREWGFLCPQGWVHWRKFMRQDGCGS